MASFTTILLTFFFFLSFNGHTCTSSYHIHNIVHGAKEPNLFQEFYNFAVKHNRPYLINKNTSELLWRFEVFKESMRRSEELNLPYRSSEKHSSPVYGVNKFADLTPQEFRDQYLSGHQEKRDNLKKSNKFTSHSVKLEELPKVVDWRNKSAVGPVHDQKQCGACWAFSVAETLESMCVIQHNNTKLPSLSEQQLIDCDTKNKGCAGGDICTATQYALQVGVVEESSYPLTRKDDMCKPLPQAAKRVKATSYDCNNWSGQEANILQALATHGPVAVAVDASTWHNYVGGIIRFHCSQHINHAVQIVGYNLEGDVPYYIIRNSWGKDFGDGGYLYVRYGKDLCGLATNVVVLSASPFE